MRIIGRFLGIVLFFGTWVIAQVPGEPELWRYALVDISATGPAVLNEIKQHPGLAWWVELEDRLLVRVDRLGFRELADRFSIERIPAVVDDRRLAFAGLPLAPELGQPLVLVRGGRFAVVQLPTREPFDFEETFGKDDREYCGHGVVLPFRPDTVLARVAANWEPSPNFQKRETVQDFVDQLDIDRWFADVYYLHCINRYARGDEVSDATWWLLEQFRNLGLPAATQRFEFSGVLGDNVIAVLEGTDRPDDWYIVGAHYDSRAESHELSLVSAPGAEDNGSGTAAVLEMARLFSQNPPQATMLFICFSGEEQGLFGSRHHADSLLDEGNGGKIKAALIMDMIGFTADDDLDCLLETGESSEPLLTPFIDAAAAYTNLRIVTSLNPFGSDHVPYLQRGMPALLVIENDWNIYPSYHRTTDLAENISLEMGAEVLKMNLAVMAELAGIPGLIQSVSESESDLIPAMDGHR